MGKKIDTDIKLRKPLTKRQKRLIEELSENTEVSVGSAMIKAGYSPETAKSPSRIVRSEPFQAFFQNKISRQMVVRAHKKLLNAKTRVRTYQKGELKTEYIQEDTLGISKGVDLAYKVMGAFAPTETKLTLTGLEGKSDAELEELLRDEQNTLARSKKHQPAPIEGEIVE